MHFSYFVIQNIKTAVLKYCPLALHECAGSKSPLIGNNGHTF